MLRRHVLNRRSLNWIIISRFNRAWLYKDLKNWNCQHSHQTTIKQDLLIASLTDKIAAAQRTKISIILQSALNRCFQSDVEQVSGCNVFKASRWHIYSIGAYNQLSIVWSTIPFGAGSSKATYWFVQWKRIYEKICAEYEKLLSPFTWGPLETEFFVETSQEDNHPVCLRI